jgi:hypothetical protein
MSILFSDMEEMEGPGGVRTPSWWAKSPNGACGGVGSIWMAIDQIGI